MKNENSIAVPRILLAAPASGSGKTMITCGLLELFRRRGLSLASFKCGPDYIDPMFHHYVLGIPGCNLDSFFLSKAQVRQLFWEKARGKDLAVVEGVMGYYDGVAGTSTQASTYEIAAATDTPVILVADGKGSSLSLAALVKGFLEYRRDSRIRAVILNRVSPMVAERLRPCLEELGIRLLGAVPECEEARLESRHLGLTLPGEQKRLREKLGRLADRLEDCLDVEAIWRLARSAGAGPEKSSAGAGNKAEADAEKRGAAGADSERSAIGEWLAGPKRAFAGRMAVARDEAFCFYYQENLELLRRAGWELVPFSPLHDKELPEAVDALLLGGGYPECYAKELSENRSMLKAVRRADEKQLKIIAECGGFLYLHDTLEGMDGRMYSMAGLVKAKAFRTGRLSRFGYITLSGSRGQIRAHEFHYWDSEAPGTAMEAKKPLSSRGWRCMQESGHMLAGFPHLYYPSNPGWILDFLTPSAENGKP